jgi:hypothetical protein
MEEKKIKNTPKEQRIIDENNKYVEKQNRETSVATRLRPQQVSAPQSGLNMPMAIGPVSRLRKTAK